MDVSEWFLVNVRLRQGCVMSPWLFKVGYTWMVPGAPERAGTPEYKWWQVLDKPAVTCG